MRYSVLLFDLDLTLFDFAGSERAAFTACCVAGGLDDTPDLFARYKVINRGLWGRVEKGEITPSQAGQRRFEILLGEFGGDTNADPAELGELFQTALGDHGDLYPGAAEVLDALAPHATMAIVTNGLTTVQQAKSARLGLGRWFDPIVISDEVGVAKPNPEIFDITFAQMPTADRSDALMIGDSVTSDMAGAIAASIATCWFAPDSATEPELGVDHRIASLDELPALLGVG